MNITKFGLAALVLMSLSACATRSAQLRDTQDRSAEQQVKDQNECLQYGSNPDFQKHQQERYVWCMKGRGYNYEIVEN